MTKKTITLPSGTSVELEIGNKQRLFAGLGLYVGSDNGNQETAPLTMRKKIEQAETMAELACMCAPGLKITTQSPPPRGLKHYNDLDDADWDVLFAEVMALWQEVAERVRPTMSAEAIAGAS